jgi:AcrR family transcriptional regulator
VKEIQREQILDAVVGVVAERGLVGATVGLVIARAGVSRRTFYECFDGLGDCLVAVMDRTLEQVGALASQAFEREGSWPDGMRHALAEVLAFFDAEPALARVCLVETLGAVPAVREQRERVVAAFRLLVVARIESEV